MEIVLAKKKISKKAVKKKVTKKKTSKSTAKKAIVERPFPRMSISEALRIPQAIKDKNNGNAYASEDVANAVDLSPKGNQFFYLSAASRDYGFTIGSRDTEKIELTELGRQSVYPSSSEERNAALLKGFKSIYCFEQVLEHFGGLNLPEMEYLSNTLTKEFGLDSQVHDDFVALYTDNCEATGVGKDGVKARQGDLKNKDVNQGSVPQNDAVEVLLAGSDDAPLCFVILPFTERDESHATGFFDEVLRVLILPAAKENGFRVITAKKSGSDVIQRTIIRNLLEADLVVADLTEHNPNVMFELGVRMAQEKAVAIIKSTETGPLFDVDHLIRVYSYNPSLWASTVKEDLPNIVEHIKQTWAEKDSGGSYISVLKG